MSDTTGRHVLNDRYEITRRIGRGGMADVFLARDLLLDRPVAIKALFPEFATDPNFVERFRREAQSAANLNHPNIVGVYDWGKYESTYFMAMEYVEGKTLADVIRAGGSISSAKAAEIAMEVAGALSFAHRNGVVHRDIKPANILIGSNGTVKVADFGIARAMNAPVESGLTQAGAVMGTATYFSPEQAQGAQPDPRSDLYSLGVVLYEMVSGRPPFTGANPVSVAYKQVHDSPQPLNRLVADIPRPFEAIVAKLLAKKPEMRYPNAEALRADLGRFRRGEPVEALARLRNNGTGQTATTAATTAAATTVMAGQPTVAGTRVMGRASTVPTGAGPYVAPPPPEDRSGWYLAAILLALAVLGLGGWLLYRAMNDDEKTVESSVPAIVMPDVVGKPIEEATRILNESNLVPDPVKQEPLDPGQPAGFVTRTEPLAQLPVLPQQKVTVYYNPTEELVNVPDVRNKTEAEARAILAEQGLAVDEIAALAEDPTVEEGRVIGTQPPATTEVKKGSKIRLVLSSRTKVKIPNVVGQDGEAAHSTLANEPYKFNVSVVPEQSASVPRGRVIRTNPPPDTDVAKASTVELVVSSGPQQVSVPEVRGLTESQARNQLSRSNLSGKVTYSELAAGDPNIGRVISQSAAVGAMVDPGTEIVIEVGKAPPPPSTTTTTTTTTTTPPPPPTTTTQPTTTSTAESTTAPTTTGP